MKKKMVRKASKASKNQFGIKAYSNPAHMNAHRAQNRNLHNPGFFLGKERPYRKDYLRVVKPKSPMTKAVKRASKNDFGIKAYSNPAHMNAHRAQNRNLQNP